MLIFFQIVLLIFYVHVTESFPLVEAPETNHLSLYVPVLRFIFVFRVLKF